MLDTTNLILSGRNVQGNLPEERVDVFEPSLEFWVLVRIPVDDLERVEEVIEGSTVCEPFNQNLPNVSFCNGIRDNG